MRWAESAGLVCVLVGCIGSMDLGVQQAPVVNWLDVRVGQNVGWSLHVGGRREWGHDHTIAHAWYASKGIIREGHGPLVLEERGWRRSRDIEDRPCSDMMLRMG